MQRLTAQGCKARREQLIARTRAQLLIISHPRHIQYLTGVYISPLALSAHGNNFLVIDALSGRSTLLLHNFLSGEAPAAHVDEVFTWTWYDAATDAGVPVDGGALEALKQHLPPLERLRVGVEVGTFPHGLALSGIEDITPHLFELRRSKFDDEQVLIDEALRVVEAGHAAIRQTLRAGISELDVLHSAQAAMQATFGGAVLMLGDFAAGERAAQGGGVATTRPLAAGDLLLADMFPLVNGYKGDITATYLVDATPSAEHRRLHDALHAALASAEGLLCAGASVAEIYRVGYAAVREYGFDASNVRHHLGHGLGLGHPEAPYLVPNSTETLRVGDVITLEPGLYTAQMGGRIEHNYRITADGYERLSRHSTAL